MARDGSQKFNGPRTRGRRVGTRAQRQRFLLVSGGKETEQQYFTYVRKELAATGMAIKVVSEGAAPNELLDIAISLRDEDRRDARRNSDRGNVFNRVWVVTDVDNFPQIPSVRQKADAEGIDIIVSNPCFELFLVLHSQTYNRNCSATAIQNVAKGLGLTTGRNNKDIVEKALVGNFQQAEGLSQAIRQMHVGNGNSFPHDNPSTEVDLLVRDLIDSAQRSIPGFEHGL